MGRRSTGEAHNVSEPTRFDETVELNGEKRLGELLALVKLDDFKLKDNVT